MSEQLLVNRNLSKKERYGELIPQLRALVEGENDLIANMANVSAALKQAFDFWWVGFYLVKEEQLVLGPFQGPIACTRIPFTKGVCGACYSQKETIIVPDVNLFEGHIACSSSTQSEIVVPVQKDGQVIAVLDVDSEWLDHFDKDDLDALEKIADMLIPVS